MNSREFLKLGYKLGEQIESHKEELAMLLEMRGSIKASGGGSGSSPRWNGDTAETGNVIRSVDLAAIIEKEIQQMEQLRLDIRTAIDSLPLVDERLVLRNRYLLWMSWEDIAKKMNFSDSQVRRIWRSAVDHIVVPDFYKKDERK